MSRRLNLEQCTAIVVAILVVAGGLGVASAGVGRARALAEKVAADSATAPGEEPKSSPFAASGAASPADPSPSTLVPAGTPEVTSLSPDTGDPARPGAADARVTTNTTTPATTTRPSFTSTTTTTTTTTTPPATTIAYYPGDTADFCARLSGVRVGAGLPDFASCGQTAALQSIALQFAQAKSVWHTGTTNEIVGITYKELPGLAANFVGSAQHYGIITAGSSDVTANVGCYYREDPADFGYRYIACIAQFAY